MLSPLLHQRIANRDNQLMFTSKRITCKETIFHVTSVVINNLNRFFFRLIFEFLRCIRHLTHRGTRRLQIWSSACCYEQTLNFLSMFLPFLFVLFCFLLLAAWAPPYLFCVKMTSLIHKKTYKNKVENLDDFVQGGRLAECESLSKRLSG